ncbi:MAG: hypothetical protein AAF961_09220, partial [Planctomycetota bacterium]
MRLAISLLTAALITPGMSLAWGQEDESVEELYDQFADFPDLLGDIESRPQEEAPKTGDVVRMLAVDEEYVGPMPEEIPSNFIPGAHRGIFAIAENSGRVAYCYDFDNPGKAFGADKAMKSPGREKTVRVILDGVPSQPYRLATSPRFRGDELTYAAWNASHLKAYRNGVPGTVSFDTVKSWRVEKFRHLRWGYIIREKKGVEPPTWRMLSADKLGPESEWIHQIDYSTDHLLLYVAADLGEDQAIKQERVVVNQEAEPWYEDVLDLTTSPDGRRYAYFAFDKEGGEDVCRVIVDGHEALV